MLLTPEQRHVADLAALDALNEWLQSQGEPPTQLVGAGVNPKHLPVEYLTESK